jgi:serine protease Do
MRVGRVSLLPRLTLAAALLALAGLMAPASADVKEKKEAPPKLPAPRKDPPLPAVFAKKAPEGVQDLRTIQAHVKKVLAKVLPSTVGIQVGGASGSGVIVSADGLVLTAGHVSGGPDRDCTLILQDGRRLKGKTLGQNRGIDSGMIKILDKGPWPFVEMGNSAKLERGQWVLATGHPGGYKKGRTPVVRLGRVQDVNAGVVTTDCTLVGGDSGGPLFDMHGRVVGIHSRIGMLITSNMHVPVNTYKTTWDRLVAGESWGGFFGRSDRPRAYMGVLRPEKDEDTECKIAKVVPGSPAEKAGIESNDVVTRFDGKQVNSFETLQGLVAKKRIGDEVMVELRRGSETKTVKLKLGRSPGR